MMAMKLAVFFDKHEDCTNCNVDQKPFSFQETKLLNAWKLQVGSPAEQLNDLSQKKKVKQFSDTPILHSYFPCWLRNELDCEE